MKLYLLATMTATLVLAAPQVNAAPSVPGAASIAILTTTRIFDRDAGIAADPADSLYRNAREALTKGDYDRAAKLFHEIGVRYPQSALLPDAMYYEAFAQYRSGGSTAMRSARDILASLQKRIPEFGRRSDAATLATRVCGELAKQGDATCAASIAVQASGSASSGAGARANVSTQCPSEDDDERVAALNALLQMDADRAEPILEKVLARRDACSAQLRRKAVFLVAQKQSPQASDVLLHVAQTDQIGRASCRERV